MKTCTKCGESKPIDHFHRNKNKKDGHTYKCKECARSDSRQWNSDNKERKAASGKNWRKANPEAHRRGRGKHASLNPESVKASKKKWLEANPEKRQQARSNYYQKNKKVYLNYGHERRARMEKGKVYLITDRDLKSLAAPCFACGSNENVHQDHIIPITRGGTHGIGNLRPMCRKCNDSKHTLTWTEWKYSGRPRAVEVFGKSAPLAA